MILKRTPKSKIGFEAKGAYLDLSINSYHALTNPKLIKEVKKKFYQDKL